ncbi:MAG: type II CAAX endopeptidase family protein [bacterium]
MLKKIFTKNKKLSLTLIILAVFYLFWTIRSWYGYSYLGINPDSNLGDEFLIWTKTFVWLPLAYLLLKLWYPKNWLKVAGFKTFNCSSLLWLIVATLIPLIYLWLIEIFFPGTYHYKPNWTFSLGFFLIRNSIIEEALFRGFLQPFLNTHLGLWKSLLIQGLLFSIIHWCWWIFVGKFSLNGVMYIWLLGIFWGYVTQKSNSIYPSIVSHTGYNLAMAMIL